jgi:hypothetical protein
MSISREGLDLLGFAFCLAGRKPANATSGDLLVLEALAADLIADKVRSEPTPGHELTRRSINRVAGFEPDLFSAWSCR